MDLNLLLLIPVLLLSVVVHEVAHGWQARREGDPTAEQLGRITLNPLPHLDLVGSVVLPLLLYFGAGGVIFGWAKPVPVNPANFRTHPGADIRVEAFAEVFLGQAELQAGRALVQAFKQDRGQEANAEGGDQDDG